MNQLEIEALRSRVLQAAEKLDLFCNPSPLMKIQNFSPVCQDIFLKCDTHLEADRASNKTRALEFLIPEIIGSQSKQAIVHAHTASSFARFFTHYADVYDIQTRYRLADIGGVVDHSELEHTFPGYRRFPRWGLALVVKFAASINSLQKKLGSKKRVFYVPPGGSTATACLGYVLAAAELAEQVQEQQLLGPLSIIMPVGTGGTVSGVSLGLSALGVDYNIHAIACISGISERAVHSKIKKIGRKARLDNFADDAASRITFSRTYLGESYGEVDNAGMAFREKSMIEIGFRFDANYSTRCLLAAVDRVNQTSRNGTHIAWITGA